MESFWEPKPFRRLADFLIDFRESPADARNAIRGSRGGGGPTLHGRAGRLHLNQEEKRTQMASNMGHILRLSRKTTNRGTASHYALNIKGDLYFLDFRKYELFAPKQVWY